MAFLYDTNYSHFSLTDLTAQLKKSNQTVNGALGFLKAELDSKTQGYLKNSWQDLGIVLNNCGGLLETAKEELSLISQAIPRGIQKNHTKRLDVLGREFGELNKDFGKAWSSSYTLHDTKDNLFWKLQSIYKKIRDDVALLSELSGIAKRLSDFEGDRIKEEFSTETLYPLNGRRWKDVTITFKNDYDVKITIKNQPYNSDYRMLGFADTRVRPEDMTTRAKKSWGFLQILSQEKGTFPINTVSEKKKRAMYKKYKQELVAILKSAFGTSEDPFEKYDREEGIYKTKFHIVPEPLFREDYRDRDIRF